jgi:16S rRNA (guanine527-N7)-methyltransferase
MADVVGGAPALVVDLGSGGGVPGLVLATCWPESRLWLVERAARRAAFLREAVHELGLEGRVEVVEESAEEVAHQPGRREQATVTVARGFASIGVTLECAAGLTAPGGRIVVAAPPQGWDLGPGVATWSRLGELGLGAPSEREADGYHFLVVAKVRPADLRYPRRWPAMRRAPLVGPREGSGGPIG